jgi:hypothetical protein
MQNMHENEREEEKDSDRARQIIKLISNATKYKLNTFNYCTIRKL